MKRLLTASIFLTLVGASLIFFRKDQAVSSNPLDPANPTTRRATRTPTDFWDSAQVPDPGESVPIATIRPEDLGVTVPTTPVEPQALIAKAVSENNLPGIQSAALVWFQQDPTAARDWLATQSTFEDLQPAISYIANHISEKGDLKTAIEWANILTDPSVRENTLFDIQALALRNRHITAAEISTDGLSSERVEELLSGAAGD